MRSTGQVPVSQTPRIEVANPIGHRRRRAEAIPLLKRKFDSSLTSRYSEAHREAIHELFENSARLDAIPVPEFMDLFWHNTRE